MRKSLVIILAILMIALPVIGQDGAPDVVDSIGGLTLESTVDLLTLSEQIAEVTGIDLLQSPSHPVAISPNGHTIAFLRNRGENICLYTIDTEAVVCSAEIESRLWSLLYWSPDSRYIAVHADAFRAINEPDIHVLDTETLTWMVLFDDGVDDLLRGDRERVLIDYLPTWHPLTNDLYFFRSTPNGDDWINEIMVVRAEDGLISPDTEAQLVADITDLGDRPFPVYDYVETTLDGSVTISPDGTMMAFLQRSTNPDIPSRILLLDLETKTVSTLVDGDDIRVAGMPAWYIEDNGLLDTDMLDGLGWRADSSGVYTTTFNSLYSQVSLSPSVRFVDISSGEVTSLLDYSDVPNLAAFMTVSDDSSSYSTANRQWSSVYIPSEDILIYQLGYVPGTFEYSGFAGMALPEGEPVVLTLVEDRLFSSAVKPSVGENETTVWVVTSNHLLTFSRDN